MLKVRVVILLAEQDTVIVKAGYPPEAIEAFIVGGKVATE
jgi:hypothetical protein